VSGERRSKGSRVGIGVVNGGGSRKFKLKKKQGSKYKKAWEGIQKDVKMGSNFEGSRGYVFSWEWETSKSCLLVPRRSGAKGHANKKRRLRKIRCNQTKMKRRTEKVSKNYSRKKIRKIGEAESSFRDKKSCSKEGQFSQKGPGWRREKA